MLGFVKFDYQYFSTVSDRYVYVAMLGAAVITAAVMQGSGYIAWANHLRCSPVATASLTLLQCGYWHDDLGLWYHTYVVNPDSFPTGRDLGKIFADRAEAERQAGNLRQAQDDNDRAIEFFEHALKNDPDPAPSHRALGELYFRLNQFSNAAAHYELALPLLPLDADLRGNLGVALVRLHRFGEARAALEDAIRLNPKSANYETNLGNVLGEQGDRPAAAEHFRRALAIDPHFTPARHGLDLVQ